MSNGSKKTFNFDELVSDQETSIEFDALLRLYKSDVALIDDELEKIMSLRRARPNVASNIIVRLSRHAILRILSRDEEKGVINLTMNPFEVLNLLEAGCYIETIQRQNKTDLSNEDSKYSYWIFYSLQDDAYFIAIGHKEYENSCEIITIIPANNKRKWMMDTSMAYQARLVTSQRLGFTPLDQFLPKPSGHTGPPYKISCCYISNGAQKSQHLFSLLGNTFTSPEEIITSSGFMQKCFDVAYQKKQIHQESIFCIVIRFDKNSDKMLIVDLPKEKPPLEERRFVMLPSKA